ncbi:MAG: methyltransferase domain-containing protein [Endomicrobium sp.]|nr:methyltransferase domain-containing protein [Endomicrobium sp.]
MAEKLEKMTDFFANRIDIYDEQMLSYCKNGYIKLAETIPDNAKFLLDLGCGTGLELVEIFKRNPKIKVTGIDLTKEMLDKLNERFGNKNIDLINADYFEYDFGANVYDVAISFETLHHFMPVDKIKLYEKIFNGLSANGKYIECDYMVIKQEEEDFCFAENKRLRKENAIKDGEFYHYDTPCTVNNQIIMLKKAGFKNVKEVWREESTTIITAEK